MCFLFMAQLCWGGRFGLICRLVNAPREMHAIEERHLYVPVQIAYAVRFTLLIARKGARAVHCLRAHRAIV